MQEKLAEELGEEVAGVQQARNNAKKKNKRKSKNKGKHKEHERVRTSHFKARYFEPTKTLSLYRKLAGLACGFEVQSCVH